MDDDVILRRYDAAMELTKAGHFMSPNRLAQFATLGGGPPMHYQHGKPVYVWRELLAWAQARANTPRRVARSFREAA